MSTPTQFGAVIGLLLLSVVSFALAMILSIIFALTVKWMAAIGSIIFIVFGLWTFLQARKT